MNILVTAASHQGSTLGIAEAIGRTLRADGLDVTVAPPDTVADASPFDAFVIGSALYMGHWLEPSTELVRRLAPTLAGRPAWLFSSGPVGDPTRGLVRKMTADPLELDELRSLTGAREHRLFAGKLSGHSLTLPRRLSLLVVRGLEGDWRDWPAIEAWAHEIAAALRHDDVASPGHVDVIR